MKKELSGSDLAYALQAVMKWGIDSAPAHLIQGFKNAFRSNLKQKMKFLQTLHYALKILNLISCKKLHNLVS